MRDKPHESAESIFGVQVATEGEIPVWFDKDEYLLANPDVARSITSGEWESAYQHYVHFGRAENRPLKCATAAIHDRPIGTRNSPDNEIDPQIKAAIDALMITPSGAIFLVGWIDDTLSPLSHVNLNCQECQITIDLAQTARIRRSDVETAIGSANIHAYGFFSFVRATEPLRIGSTCRALMHLRNDQRLPVEVPVRHVTEIVLRDTLLGYIADCQMFGNRQIEAFRMLRGPLSVEIAEHNRDITRKIIKGAYVERFSLRCRNPKASMVVCLYGKPEYLFLQSALFADGDGFADYEMIYVCNSPEMSEKLMKDARTCAMMYGLSQTVILLPDNAGFGAANNIAVSHARSDRVLIVNPDVFPYDPAWAKKHTEAVNTLPSNQTKLLGALLYYDDGSLMHGGMYFECDSGPSLDSQGVSGQQVLRVEHYGKGAPSWSDRFNRRRPVPAVTGAFISADRAWYDKLGGFTEDFVFGHYEDADLCLKSISAGVAPWVHDIRLWHLEGQGSPRLPVHQGASLVNRALFSDRWQSFVETGLVGPNPSHPVLRSTSRHEEPAPVDGAKNPRRAPLSDAISPVGKANLSSLRRLRTKTSK